MFPRCGVKQNVHVPGLTEICLELMFSNSGKEFKGKKINSKKKF
jgi:hypothetical protein